MLASYLPHLSDLAAVLVAWALVPVLVSAGGVAGRFAAPELRFLAGWGLFCLVLTLWGVATPASLRWPAGIFAVLALAALSLPHWRPSPGQWRALGRMLVLSLPFWLILAPIRPSQPDTYLNLLPNAFYLLDHGFFPTVTRPDAYSFLPVAPYNTQFAAFLGGMVLPDFPGGGMSFFNLLLQLAVGMVFARAIESRDEAGEAVPSWGAMAAGLLLAIPLNPGFVPRIFLTAYGEPALAATAAAALWCILFRPGWTLGLGLVLAAMVNIKQSGIGLVAAIAVAYAVLAVLDGRRPLGSALRTLLLALLPALLLYGLWRWFVLTEFPTGELTPLAWRDWQWGLLPQIFASMGADILDKGVYFGLVLLTIPLLVRALLVRGWSNGARALCFHAVLFVAYNAFLVTTYIGHFQGKEGADAHSYFRYNMHLSLVLVLAYILALREEAALVRAVFARPRAIGAVALLLVLLLPFAFVQRLRFDLVLPQPLVWSLAKEVAPQLSDNGRLALLLPGDNTSVETMLAGVLRWTAPRRPYLDILVRDKADAETLAEVRASGYDLALVSCTTPLMSAGIAGMPAGSASLLRWRDGRWQPLASWPWPKSVYTRHWQAILAFEPLCRTNASESVTN
jgi:hypothetical protein